LIFDGKIFLAGNIFGSKFFWLKIFLAGNIFGGKEDDRRQTTDDRRQTSRLKKF